MRDLKTIIASLLENRSVFTKIDGDQHIEIITVLKENGFKLVPNETADADKTTTLSNGIIRTEITVANFLGIITDIRTFFVL